jgi:2-oxoglutarate dehydrogenase E2 component (dihydrolipoamide succinyltransferase)
MPTNIPMPQMGESIFEGTITKWLKKEGDRVERDENLFEISTDKVETVIPSPTAGVLQRIICPAGSKVPVNTVVAIVEESGGAPSAAAVPAAKPAAAAAASSPAAPAAPAPAAVAVAVAPAPPGEGRRVFSSPLVRSIAKKEGVDIGQITGSGWKGRVTKKDIIDHLNSKPVVEAPAAPRPEAPPAPKAPAAPAPAPRPAAAPAAPSGRVQVVPMTNMRAKIAEHMTMSKRTSAHVTTVFEVDMSKVVELREREKENYQTVFGTKLTYTHFFGMAAVQALKEFPTFNASVDGTNVVLHNYINLGIAVAVPEGLIVPVVRNAEEKSFLGLARAVNDVAERARTKKLAIDDVQGGTFTVTNPGSFGGLFATPIINQPQVAILGIGTIQKRAVVINDAIAIRSMCYIDLSFDHRLIDGLDAEKFMARVKEMLETWNTPIK